MPEFLRKGDVFCCELRGGPQDGETIPLLVDGSFKHPATLTERDSIRLPSAANPKILDESEEADLGSSLKPGEFAVRTAVYTYESVEQRGEILVPVFRHTGSSDQHMPEKG